MKTKLLLLSIAALGLTLISCDETTDMVGSSLTDNVDRLHITADTFSVSSKSILADSVLARSTSAYLGRIKDPETGVLLTGNLMTQLHVLSSYELPAIDSIMSRDENGQIEADSCDIRLYFPKFYGDSLAQIKLTAYELDKPVEEEQLYYSNFDPEAKGYLRPEGVAVNRTYTLADLTEEDCIRDNSSYSANINVRLNAPYTAKDGKTYKNYGTYLLRKYLEDPTAFRSNYRFLHEVCPGFYFKITNGLGSMAQVNASQLNVYFKYKNGGKVVPATTNLVNTEEVLQMTNFSTDKKQLENLVAEQNHTYLKTPAGIFTELTLPVTSIIRGHETDSINSAKIELYRVNNSNADKYELEVPKNILMIPADSLHSFFIKNRLPDSKTSFLATYSAATNSYAFNNISGIINMFARNQSEAATNKNWGKVVLIPVELSVSTRQSGTQTISVITKTSHYLGLSSTKLQGGEANPDKIRISVIYSKFNGR
ncbi:DUF4270 domain-containing protein [Prevotella dentasini]|uniref:DUF4270 domain-containing protein n=1 Tax=Prevotella dentasini TaxID=589537 RepID=UPI000469B308|nr:DUF4270 domain-containing protein [Prevotella dentasini]